MIQLHIDATMISVGNDAKMPQTVLKIEGQTNDTVKQWIQDTNDVDTKQG